MKKVLVIMPGADNDEALETRKQQAQMAEFGDDVEFHFRPIKINSMFGSYHDWLLLDLAVFEAGLDAEQEGFDAVAIDTMSDGGLNYLRCVLDIPVIGAGQAAYHTALLLGNKFSIVTMWDAWYGMYEKNLADYDLMDHCASIRAVDVVPDLDNYLGGKEEVVFPALVDVSMKCIEEDGADVICIGSTSMFQAHDYMKEHLPVPVTNPGALVYKMTETILDMGLTHTRRAYRKPDEVKRDTLHAMLDAAYASEHPEARV